MDTRIDGSFRDPSGFLYRRDGRLLRQVNNSYGRHYDAALASGLYDRLVADGLLVPHTELEEEAPAPGVRCVLQPEEIPYVSYPYEWCFSQLRDAALLTLDIQEIALAHGMSLKDASAYNVQFRQGRPIFIDTLSFECYEEGRPWVAYRQFCQHFLAPLTLMAVRDLRLRQLCSRYLDGVPLDLASELLPASSWFSYSTLAHIHMHARSQRKHEDDARAGGVKTGAKLSKSMLSALIASLKSAVSKLSSKDERTEWSDYYGDTNYTADAMQHKATLLERYVGEHFDRQDTVHDLGANTGRFSRIIAAHCDYVVSHDMDELAVERNYRESRSNGPANVLPLVLDLGNPSGAIGWDLKERLSFHERAQGDSAVALALVHHLCITNNVPIPSLARFFHGIFDKLIIEFVPKEDSQVQRMLATRQDVFDGYDKASFEREFGKYFSILEQSPVEPGSRTLYAMRKRVAPS